MASSIAPERVGQGRDDLAYSRFLPGGKWDGRELGRHIALIADANDDEATALSSFEIEVGISRTLPSTSRARS